MNNNNNNKFIYIAHISIQYMMLTCAAHILKDNNTSHIHVYRKYIYNNINTNIIINDSLLNKYSRLGKEEQ